MGYECRMERDSISPSGVRLSTFVIRYPRRVLAEEVTHRMVSDNWGEQCVVSVGRSMTENESKNSASSRAIPLKVMIDGVRNDPFFPQWTRNQSGMQGEGVSDPEVIEKGNTIWAAIREQNIEAARRLHELGFHKQDCNRLLEPFAWITQVVTSSAWDNFFSLRCDQYADPHLRHIARLMFLHRRQSVPQLLEFGQWHLPFVPFEEQMKFEWRVYDPLGEVDAMPDLIQCSAARCAWISYMNHDKDGTLEQMKKTYHRLITSRPVHASPVEHQATPLRYGFGMNNRGMSGNLKGYIQARKLVPHEAVTNYDPPADEVKSWGIDL